MAITPEQARAELERRRALKSGESTQAASGITPDQARAELARRRGGTPAPSNEGDGIGEMLQYGNDRFWKNTASTVGHLAPLGEKLGLEGWRIKGVAKDISGWTEAPENYTPAAPVKNPEGAWYYPGTYDGGQVVKSLFEAGPSLGYGAAGALAGPLGLTASATLAGGAETFGPILDERMKLKGLTDPSQLEAEDYALATGASAAIAALNRVGLGTGKASKALTKLNRMGRPGQIVSNVARKSGFALKEGSTETVQDIVQQGAQTALTPEGIEIDPRQAVASGLAGGGARAGVSAPGVAIDTVDSLLGPQYKAKNKKAANALANMMKDIAVKGKHKTNDLTTQQYANETSKMVVKGAYQQIAEGIKLYAGMLKPMMDKETPELADLDFDNILGVENPNRREDGSFITDPLDPESKIVINTALRAGRNQHEGGVSPDAIDLIERKFGQFEEGRRLAELLKVAQEYKGFHDSYRKGPTGGILGATWNSRPAKAVRSRLGANLAGGLLGGSAITTAATPGAASAGLAALLDPTTLVTAGIGTTLAAGALALDKRTGRRHKVERLFKDYGNNRVKPNSRKPGVSIADFNKYQEELARVETDAQRTQADALNVVSDDLYRRAMAQPDGLSMDWLMENSQGLVRRDFDALKRRIEANEREATRQAKANAKDAKSLEAIQQKEWKDNLLKELVDDWRGNRPDPRKLQAARPYLTPQEYERFTRQQLGADQRVVKFAYQMASQKAAEAEAIAAEAEATAKALDKVNLAFEAAAARADAADARAEAIKQAKDAAQIKINVESTLALKQHDGTLKDTDVLENKDILGPAKLKTWLAAARRIEDARVKEEAKKAQKVLGLRVHRGSPKPVDPMKDISKKASAIVAMMKMRKAEMDRAERLAKAPPRKTPVTRVEALGGERPIVSEAPATVRTPMPNRETSPVGNEERYDAKVRETTEMEDGIERIGEALLGTADFQLGEAYVQFIRGVRKTAKNDIDLRAAVQQEIANNLPPEARSEFLEVTDELTQAFGVPLSVLGNAVRDAKRQGKQLDLGDEAPF